MDIKEYYVKKAKKTYGTALWCLCVRAVNGEHWFVGTDTYKSMPKHLRIFMSVYPTIESLRIFYTLHEPGSIMYQNNLGDD